MTNSPREKQIWSDFCAQYITNCYSLFLDNLAVDKILVVFMATMTDTQLYFMCFLLFFLSTLLLKPLYKKPSKTLRLPPSPLALPVLVISTSLVHPYSNPYTTSPPNMVLSSISALVLLGVSLFQQPPGPPKYLKPMTLFLLELCFPISYF